MKELEGLIEQLEAELCEHLERVQSIKSTLKYLKECSRFKRREKAKNVDELLKMYKSHLRKNNPVLLELLKGADECAVSTRRFTIKSAQAKHILSIHRSEFEKELKKAVGGNRKVYFL